LKTELKTERLILRVLTKDDAEMFRDFLLRNKEFFKLSGPAFEENYADVEYHRIMLERSTLESMDGRHYKFGVFKTGVSPIIGSVALSNIVMGNFCSCFLGYRIDKSETSKGYATEAVDRIVSFAFNDLELHRIEANIMPANMASINVVNKLGFTNEGISKKYLKINGKWEDHMHFVKLNENPE
jgi:ribosomal-protein-alanine N-acetyltransferase